MLRLAATFLASVFSLSAFSQVSMNDYPADKVSEHVYVIHGPKETPNPQNRGFMNNPAFIVADKGVIVVDPGSSYETGAMVIKKIKAVTDKPVTHIFNTHIHGDHWLGNDIIRQSYPDVIIYADPRMIEKARAGEAQNWIDMLDRMTDGATRGTKIAYPGVEVNDGDQFKIHNLSFRMHSVGIAHSDSDVMIELVDDSLMFTGDNVAYERILRMDHGNFKDTIAACDKAIGLGLKTYVPGHGPSGGVERVKMQKQYLETVYNEVSKYYDEGLSDFEMKPRVVKALQAYSQWSGFEQQVGRHVSLALLEVEKAEFE